LTEEKEQTEIKRQVDEANSRSEERLERHHKVALGVTFFPVALSAMSALLKRQSGWTFSLVVISISLVFFFIAL